MEHVHSLSQMLCLHVAGGEGKTDVGRVATTKVLNTATFQWSTAADLLSRQLLLTLLIIFCILYSLDEYKILIIYWMNDQLDKYTAQCSQHKCTSNKLLQQQTQIVNIISGNNFIINPPD